MQPGDRCIYIPPPGDPRPQRWATVHAISGPSAFVIFDHLGWLSAAPIERLHLAPPGAAGYFQIALFNLRETQCPTKNC